MALPPMKRKDRPTVPDVFSGAIYESVGKYARGAVLYAFEQVGGPDALAEWAQDNPDDFYTKLFPKIITRETEVHHHKSVDDLMDAIDVEYEVEEVVPVDMITQNVNPYAEAFGDDDPADSVRLDDGWDADDMVDFDE